MPATVTVACKVPNGLILRLFKMETRHEPILGGGTREFQIAVKHGPELKVKGPAVPFGLQPLAPIAGGYALTRGIPKEFWEEWLKQNADADIVKEKLVFAHAIDTAGEAKENRKRLSGFERIDPTKPLRHRTPGGGKVTVVAESVQDTE